MFFYDKKIVYLGLFHGDEKMRNCGAISLEVRDTLITMTIRIGTLYLMPAADYSVQAKLMGEEEYRHLGTIYLRQMGGSICIRLDEKENENFLYQQLSKILIPLTENYYIIGTIRKEEEKKIVAEPVDMEELEKSEEESRAEQENGNEWAEIAEAMQMTEKDESEESDVDQKTEDPSENQKIEVVETQAIKDADIASLRKKWKELKQGYPNIHPFTDDSTFLAVKPEDFSIFDEESKKLSENSFLLHGYYNYHRLLLGFYQNKFYIGVPGNFYDREKTLAAMFGFEGFAFGSGMDEMGHPDAGTFGYYMKQVGF